MVYTYKELKKKYGSDYQIKKAVKNGILYKIELVVKIENKLRKINLSKYKDSMRLLIKKDIDYILEHI